MALCLESLGRAQEALAKYEAAVDMFQRLFDSNHPHVFCQDVPASLRQEYSNRLPELSELWRRAEAGTSYDAKAAEWLARFEQWKTTTQPAEPQGP